MATYTLVCKLQKFIPDAPDECIVNQLSDIDRVFLEMDGPLRRKIIPFLEQTQDLISVSKHIDYTDIQATSKTLSAITVAELTNNPVFDQMIVQYTNKTYALPQNVKDENQRFFDHLRRTNI